MSLKLKNDHFQERVSFALTHGAVTATTAEKVWSPTRKFLLERVWYNNPTGLAEDPTDFFDIQILKGATVAANHSTETGREGTLTADTPVELVLSATQANRVFDAGDVMSLNLDEGGTATLPAGRLMIEGRYLD